ncbi:MAG: ATP-binding protein [Bacteroidales bacterium]|nr:response regulator [Bacteroidales bacterium]MDD4491414.1 ATP-binding protein [Bacteroidales bacterium]
MLKRIFLVICFLTSVLLSAYAQENAFPGKDTSIATIAPKKILMVYSKERTNDRIREFAAGFASYHSNNRIFSGIINLHLNPNGDRTKEEMFDEMVLATKTTFVKNKIDLIIATDSEAYEMLYSADSLISDDIPVACIYLENKDNVLPAKFSRIVTTMSFEENIKLGLQFFPAAKDILFIFDDSQYGEKEALLAKKISLKYAGLINFSFLSTKGISYQDFIKRINSSPLNSFIILSTWQMDTQGNYRIYGNFFPFLSRIERIPVLGVQNLSLGTGILGGYVTSSWDQGYKAAGISQKLLNNPKQIISDTIRDVYLKLDFNQMKRWRISKDNLPKNAEIINKPPSLYDDYKTEVQLFMAFILLLFTSLMVFAVYHFRYRMLNKELIKVTRESIQRKDLLNSTLSVMNEAVISFDPNMLILEANKAALGLSEHITNLTGRKFHEIFSTSHSGEECSIEKLLKESLETKKTIRIPDFTRIDYKERESKFISGDISPVLENGNVIHLVMVIRDVTDFFKKQRYLTLALESAKSFIWFFNSVTKQFVISENYENVFGSLGESFSSHSKFLEIVHPDDRKKLVVAFDNMRNQKTKSVTVEYRLSVNRDDKWQWWERRGIIYSDVNKPDDFRFLYGMDINIDSLKKRETDLLDAKLKAEESDRLKSAFLSNMSHEIRTPLNGIVGFASLLTDPDYSESEKTEFANIINTNSKILMALISDILDLSRIESNSMSFEFSKFDLSQQINETIDSYKLSLPEGIELTSDVPKEPLLIFADSIRNRQILNNLINNAIKFTPKGKITVGYKETEKGVEIFVKDTGKGIKEDQQSKIFERFYKADEFTTGTGLGLSICKAIVQKFAGEIWVESKNEKGASFHYTIPKDSCYAENEEDLAEALLSAETGEVKKTILVAEDLDSNYLLIEIILSKRYNVIRAKDGKEAISLFTEQNPDLILMDIKMPVMDGLEATKEIRNISGKVPIIALTANAFESDQIEAKTAGCNEVLTKPVKSSLLYLVIEKYLKQQY